jgi:hypothetical protein
MRLAEYQQSFWQAVRTRGAPPSGLGDWLTGSVRQTATERLAIYHLAYWQRQVGALASSFPRLQTLLGAQHFERLLLAYIEACPGTDPCIENCGQGLVDFLTMRHDVAPVALGVARLEWASLESLLSPDALNVAELPLQLGERFADCRLRFIPSLRALSVPVESLRAFAPAEREASWVSSSSSVDVVFSRPRFAVHHVTLEADEAQALALGLDGRAIGAMCGVFAELPDAKAVPRASSVLSSWFARRWVASCSV